MQSTHIIRLRLLQTLSKIELVNGVRSIKNWYILNLQIRENIIEQEKDATMFIIITQCSILRSLLNVATSSLFSDEMPVITLFDRPVNFPQALRMF